MKIVIKLILSLMLVFAFSANAWNTAAHGVNWVEFDDSGLIRFTLFANGNSGASFQCDGNANTKLHIRACDSANNQCVAASNRMGSVLLAARLAGSTVHVHNVDCTVTAVALAD